MEAKDIGASYELGVNKLESNLIKPSLEIQL